MFRIWKFESGLFSTEALDLKFELFDFFVFLNGGLVVFFLQDFDSGAFLIDLRLGLDQFFFQFHCPFQSGVAFGPIEQGVIKPIGILGTVNVRGNSCQGVEPILLGRGHALLRDGRGWVDGERNHHDEIRNREHDPFQAFHVSEF